MGIPPTIWQRALPSACESSGGLLSLLEESPPFTGPVIPRDILRPRRSLEAVQDGAEPRPAPLLLPAARRCHAGGAEP